MRTSEEEAPDEVAKLMSEETQYGIAMKATLIKPTSNLYVSSNHNINMNDYDVVISCTPEPPASATTKRTHDLHLTCQTGKLGSRDLRIQLPRLSNFLETFTSLSPKILICCSTGKDLAVGAALAILCLYTDNDGNIDLHQKRKVVDIDKNFIKQRLSWITTSNPALNPSRATLQSVNAVLLESQDPKAHQNSLQSLPIRTKVEPTAPQAPHSPTRPLSLPSNLFTKLLAPPTTPWTFHRTLSSTLPTHPSGTVTGTATFSPCSLTDPAPPTLLYAEQGDFITSNGMKFSARRKYVYQLQQSHDDEEGKREGELSVDRREEGIVVRFFDDEKLPRASISDGVGEKGEGVGGLFVEMGTLKLVEEGGDGGVYEAKNKEQHLCAEDLYTASWKFSGEMTREGGGQGEGMWWEVRYDVKGPQKDYVSVTRYEKK
jgi:tRNA A64-2'-O-ribosylphosphate transferase